MREARTSAKPVRLSATSNLHVLSSMPGKEKERPGPVCMEKGFRTLPVNSTQAVATVAVRIWFGSHA